MMNLSLCFTVFNHTPWAGHNQPQGRSLHRKTQTQNKRRQIFMPRVGFESTTPVFQGAKIGHVSDREATVIGSAT
jgi:hypothetical protein